jgi:hypothetical protein
MQKNIDDVNTLIHKSNKYEYKLSLEPENVIYQQKYNYYYDLVGGGRFPGIGKVVGAINRLRGRNKVSQITPYNMPINIPTTIPLIYPENNYDLQKQIEIYLLINPKALYIINKYLKHFNMATDTIGIDQIVFDQNYTTFRIEYQLHISTTLELPKKKITHHIQQDGKIKYDINTENYVIDIDKFNKYLTNFDTHIKYMKNKQLLDNVNRNIIFIKNILNKNYNLKNYITGLINMHDCKQTHTPKPNTGTTLFDIVQLKPGDKDYRDTGFVSNPQFNINLCKFLNMILVGDNINIYINTISNKATEYILKSENFVKNFFDDFLEEEIKGRIKDRNEECLNCFQKSICKKILLFFVYNILILTQKDIFIKEYNMNNIDELIHIPNNKILENLLKNLDRNEISNVNVLNKQQICLTISHLLVNYLYEILKINNNISEKIIIENILSYLISINVESYNKNETEIIITRLMMAPIVQSIGTNKLFLYNDTIYINGSTKILNNLKDADSFIITNFKNIFAPIMPNKSAEKKKVNVDLNFLNNFHSVETNYIENITIQKYKPNVPVRHSGPDVFEINDCISENNGTNKYKIIDNNNKTGSYKVKKYSDNDTLSEEIDVIFKRKDYKPNQPVLLQDNYTKMESCPEPKIIQNLQIIDEKTFNNRDKTKPKIGEKALILLMGLLNKKRIQKHQLYK